jgi:ABC-type multidrug transport system fused ATPase/permease subunit
MIQLYKICSFLSIFFIFVGFSLLIAYVTITREVIECFHHSVAIDKTIHCAALVPIPAFQMTLHEEELINKIDDHSHDLSAAYHDVPVKSNISSSVPWVAVQFNEITKEIQWFQGGPLLYQCLTQYKLHTNRGPFTVCFRTQKYEHLLFYLGVAFIFFAIPFFFLCTCKKQQHKQ